MSVYDEHVPESGGGLYLKLEDDKTYTVRIVSEPVIFDNVYRQGNSEQISTKYSWIVWNLKDNAPQVIQLPVTAYRMIADIAKNPKWGEPTSGKYDLDIKRTKEGQRTTYSVVPSPADEQITEEQQAEIDKIDLLKAVEAGKGVERAMWLKDALKGRPAREKGTVKPTAQNQEEDVVIEDIDPDEEINLDDIPF